MELMLKPEVFTFTQLSDAEFEKCAAALSPLLVPLEQSPLWGAFDESIAGREFLGSFRYDDTDGKLIALGSATLYKQKGRNWIWFKHGPLFASVPNTDVVQALCTTLRRQFQSHASSPVFIRLTSPTFTKPLNLPFEHTMYDETVVVDLEQTEDDILSGMSQSGRRSLRNAQKQAVEIEEITNEKSSIFKNHCYPILEETGARDGFGIHPLKLYTSLLETLPQNSRLYVAKMGKNIEAWAITTEYNAQAMYYYGGSSAKARKHDAAYKLHWEIMMAMKNRANKTYDFMGIAGKHFEGLKNVTQFKLKFSKNVVSVPITYDLPLQPVKYRALSFAINLKRKLR